MRNLGVWIEIGGLQTYVGHIIGEQSYAKKGTGNKLPHPFPIPEINQKLFNL